MMVGIMTITRRRRNSWKSEWKEKDHKYNEYKEKEHKNNEWKEKKHKDNEWKEKEHKESVFWAKVCL